MPSWTFYSPPAEADLLVDKLRAYFDDPEIIWLDAPGSLLDAYGKPRPIPASGFYIVNFCRNIHCCFPFGPFASIEEARDWSRKNLPETGAQTEPKL